MSRRNIAFMATGHLALERRFFGKLLLVVAASLAVKSLAQTSPPPFPSSQPPASTAVAPSVFEVAAIKQNQSGSGSSRSNTNNGRFTATNVSLKNLIEYQAYGIPGSRILDGPKSLDSTRFDIEAKMDDFAADHLRTLTHAQRRLETQALFQQLLADRFKLAVHWETRELPSLCARSDQERFQTAADEGSTEGSGTSSNDSRSGAQFTAKGVTLPELATGLTQAAVQRTGPRHHRQN